MALHARDRSWLAAGLLAALVLVGIACTDDPVCPDFQLGAIEGVVTSVGEPVAGARIKAYPYGSQDDASRVLSVTDASGHYRLEVSPGLYKVEVDADGDPWFNGDRIDTVRVGTDTVHLDAHWSRAEVDLDLPPTWEGQNVNLWLHGASHFGTNAQVQDGHATFIFPLIKPLPYTMKLTSPAWPVWLPGVMFENEPRDTLHVTVDAPAGYNLDLSHAFSILEGRIIRDWTETDIFYPWVHVMTPDSLWLGETYPEEDGTFSIEMPGVREVVLSTVSSKGLERWVGGSTFAAATRFALQPDTPVTGVEIPESLIRLTLTGPEGTYQHQASVVLIDPDGREHHLFRNGSPDPVLIHNPPPGSWYLMVHGYNTGQTWAARWYPAADSLAAAEPVVVGDNALVDLSMDLVAGGSISGQVLLEGVQPLVPVACWLTDRNGQPLVPDDSGYSTFFDNGSFAFTGLPNGAYYLATHPIWSSETVWYPGVVDFGQAEAIVISDYGSVEGLVIDVGMSREVGP